MWLPKAMTIENILRAVAGLHFYGLTVPLFFRYGDATNSDYLVTKFWREDN